MDRPPSRSRAPMSLEDSLDEENREVLAALDKRSPSPMARITHARTATPPPPSHSRLYVDAPTPRHGSIAGIGVGITSPTQSRKSGALDPSDPSTYTSPHSSKSTSPVLTKAQPSATRQRAVSEVNRPAGLPTLETSNIGLKQKDPSDIASIYVPSNAGTFPRLETENKRPRQGSSPAMAAAITGDFSKLYVGLPGGKPVKDAGAARGHSRSPSSRSRKSDTSQGALLSPRKSAGPLATGSGANVDHHTTRRLSNKSGSFSTFTEDSEEGGGRIHADGIGEEDALAESSDDDAEYSSSDDDETRGRSDRRKYSAGEAAENKPPETTIVASPLPQTPSTPSLPKEPSISITDPAGESFSAEKPEVHPPTNFARSQSVSSHEDEDEEVAAIRKAKSLALNMSPLDTNVANRHVQILLRGNWVQFHQEAEGGQGHRQSRTYLVCSDLSTEATYAMEWVVGTMLRNGDTLLAIYAIEDESAGKPTEAEKDILHAEGAQAGKAASEVMDVLTRQTTQGGGTSVGLNSQNKYVPATEIASLSGSVDARNMSKKDMERLKGVEAVTQTFIRLVRKTTLEVRCMIEVIHCKSPKHLILGAIDELEPTLCVVGTRGRSSLKGVLLGSFSNYLVTKSSVPVMVARRRLKKPRSDVRISSTKIRLTNNLTASHVPVKRRGLTQARID
ncbi:hypothetical protein PV11_02585 [Exophiala sideris]|uniref:UspA domain-containing protein n=1 Tax=Exophiala sideris TaxID=1016849 RepID=A0A0D1YWX0_9EURO|nr:hypothetical protein PV11_02585 [Exophiala sideris]